MTPIQVFAVYDYGMDGLAPRGTLLHIWPDIETATQRAGHYGVVEPTWALRDSATGEYFLLARQAPVPMAVDLCALRTRRKQEALAKLTEQDREALGLKTP